MSPISVRIGVTLSIGMLLLAAACSDARKTGAPFNSETGKHPANWIVDHRSAFLSDSGLCTTCHGSDLMQPTTEGGISRVSCYSASFKGMSCHANGPGHANPSAWANPAQHGASAKAAPNPATTSGFSTCQLCHGSDFAGGLSSKTCLNTAGCHGVGVNAPHAYPWLPTSTYKHNTTDEGNASVCARCHTNGANSPIPPPSPAAPPNTAPGCFNSTLCHAQAGHPANWALPSAHGATAKSVPTSTSGLSYCQTCHGNDFTGGAAAQTCLSTAGCHGASVNAPHAFPWKPGPGDTYLHTSTDQGNAPVCGLCHLYSRATPSYVPIPVGTPAIGCFNNTLCHDTSVGTCVTCHGTPVYGRRIVTGTSGDFVKTDHHVTNGTTNEIVTVAACIICHGDLIADKSHPTGTLPSAPNVQLMDPKTGAYVTNDSTGVEKVCASCHDGTGATRLVGNALTPFSVASDNTNPPNIGWTTGQQAHSYNTGNGAGGCLACHGNAAATGTAKKNAHGSDQSKMMQFTYNTTIAAYPATNAGNFCFNCHGTTVANGATSNIQTQFTKTRKHSSEKCTDCHNPHQAKAGTHTAQTNIAGGVLNGAIGAELTTNPGFWAAPLSTNFTATTIVSGTDLEATLCFKCHTAYSGTYNTTSPSGSYAMTDVAREFNPNNVGNFAGTWASGETAGSFHPVLAASTNNLGRTNNVVAPWTTSSLMTCSDCHASDTTTDPNGPHGSAANFILKGPNTTWNATITSLANNAWMPAGTFCLNCHANNDSNGRYPEHSRDDHSINCSKCHIMIPHGSEHPGLLHSIAGRGAGVPAPTVVNSAPYMRATTGDRLYINSYPANNTTNWQQNNCGCNGSGH